MTGGREEGFPTPACTAHGLVSCGVCLLRRVTAERDEARAERNAILANKRVADCLADEVAALVRRQVIDSRSPAADALLDYRNPPSTPRANRLADLERERDEARAQATNAVARADHLAEMRAKVDEELVALRAEVAKLREPRWFPLQTESVRGPDGYKKPQRTRIPWSVAEKAYGNYAARYGHQQSLEQLAARGGFGQSEMDDYLPTWREEADENQRLTVDLGSARAEAGRLRAALEDAARSLETVHGMKPGRDPGESLLDTLSEARSYAGSRAGVARAALAGPEHAPRVMGLTEEQVFFETLPEVLRTAARADPLVRACLYLWVRTGAIAVTLEHALQLIGELVKRDAERVRTLVEWSSLRPLPIFTPDAPGPAPAGKEPTHG